MSGRDALTTGATLLIVAAVVWFGVLRPGPADDPSAASTPLPVPTASHEARPAPSELTLGVDPSDGRPEPLPAALVVDADALPVRPVAQARLVTKVFGDDVPGGGLLALDEATGTWAWSDLEWTGTEPLTLSPDGRHLARTAWAPTGASRVEVVALGSGDVHEIAVPLEPDCTVLAIAWAPDGRHLGVVAGCFVPTTDPDAPQVRTAVREVDLTTGAARTVEDVPDSYPSEAYPSYSPDGRLLAYGVGYARTGDSAEAPDGEGWGAVRVTPVHGGEAREWEALHVAYGDPWRDAGTLLAWDELGSVTGPDSHLLLDTATGARAPYGIDRLTNLRGYVAGTLLAEHTGWVEEPIPCTVALCTVDLGTGVVAPWLTLPDGMRAGFVGPARALLTG